MANLSNTGEANQAAFGQLGSCFCNTTTTQDLTCPSGYAFVAITCLEDTTFRDLQAVNNKQIFGSDGVDNDFDATGDRVTSSDVFPKGITIYGKWDTVDIASGSIIAYYGPA